ncbi:MAG: hypothetical protein JST89_04150 [Cyanobacteria bacterium SZAS-4]|nr:hypothetical protein [Cyanobacteria bacterium SZAS-4]
MSTTSNNSEDQSPSLDEATILRKFNRPFDATKLKDQQLSYEIHNLTKLGQSLNQRFPKYLEVKREDDTITQIKKKLVKLGYCADYSRLKKSKDLRNQFKEILEWLVTEYPASFLLSVTDYPIRDHNYEILKELWTKYTGCSNVDILNNAAKFQMQFDETNSESLWSKCQKIEPSAQWAYELTSIYWGRAINAKSKYEKQRNLELALDEFEQVLTLPNDYPDRSYISPSLISSRLNDLERLCDKLNVPPFVNRKLMALKPICTKLIGEYNLSGTGRFPPRRARPSMTDIEAENSRITDLIGRLPSNSLATTCTDCGNCGSSKDIRRIEIPVLGTKENQAVVTFHPACTCTRCKLIWFPALPDEPFHPLEYDKITKFEGTNRH